jgi:dTDP-4-dehydrorhamnose 3,5-epimerase
MPNTTEFIIRGIPGLLEIDITLLEDPRGWFQEKFQRDKLVSAGFPHDFVPVQHNISYNKEVGVTRGFHAEPWRKYVSVVSGKVHAVFVDLRQGPSFGRKMEIVIDPKKAVFIPKGVANSFQTLEPHTFYTYLVDGHWSPDSLDKYRFVNLADPNLSVSWPIPLERAIISEKDKNHPFLRDVIPFNE